MRRQVLVGTLVGFAMSASLAACNKPAPAKVTADPAKAEESIKADEAAWNADWKARDADKINAHYAADAVLMAPGAPPGSAADARLANIKQALSDPGFSLTFSSDKVDVAASGDMAASHGSYTETDTDPKTKQVMTTTGNYVTIYKPQADGSWKATYDINTPAGPPMPGKAAAKPS